MGSLRVCTFNLENLDESVGGAGPSLDDRIAVLRPQLVRARADILCLQEVHGQEREGNPRRLLALERLLDGTEYESFHVASTTTRDRNGHAVATEQVYDHRNLVVVSRYPFREKPAQYKHHFVRAPQYRAATADGDRAREISWERPIFHTIIDLPGDKPLHVINLHLKSKRPTSIDTQMHDPHTWKTASGWAEGYFISSMKRVGQALETRMLIDGIQSTDPDALVVVCGDFNSDFDDVPVEAIRGSVTNTNNRELSAGELAPCELSIPESTRFTYVYQGSRLMIDHILVSRALLAHYAGAEVHNEFLRDESIAFRTEKLYPESDHAPVVASFVFPES